MPVNFPANPSLNNTYTFSGRTWTWNGTYWDQTPNASQAEAINGIPVGNVTPATGAFTELSVTGNILTDSYRYANGDPFVSSNYGDSNVATYLGNIGGNVLPAANITYDLGSDTNRWRDIYLANSTIHLGSQQISADGSGLNLPSSVSIGNVTLDTSSGNLSLPAGSSIDGAAVATPRISSIDYPGDDTAADTAGGQTLGIVGSGFVSGASVILDGTSLGTVTVVSSTRIEITAPAKSAGSYTLYVINSDGGTGIFIPGVQYSGLPTWSSPAAGSLGTVYETANVTATFSATSDSSVTYSLLSGDLPAGASLDSSTGVLSGTANLIAGSSVTYSFTVRATDAENQDTDRAFSLTIDADSVTWASPTDGDTISVPVDTASTTTLSAASAAGDSITYSANALPTGLSLSGNTITGTANTVANTSVALTATTDTTTRSATITVTFAVTLPLDDEYFNLTTLLLNADDNTFITDASDNAFTITPAGDTRPSAFSPYNTGWSNYFDGTGDFLSLAATDALSFGTGDFTVEGWFNASIVSGQPCLLGIGGDNNGLVITFYGTAIYAYFVGAGGVFGSGNAIIANRWYHFAWTRSSGVNKFFLNGTQDGNNYTNPGNHVSTGGVGIGDQVAGTNFGSFTGYISNIRVVKGTAVYTSNFTPPTAPLEATQSAGTNIAAITGTSTSLLTCQSNRLIDNSPNIFPITRNGDVKVTAFAPFTDTDTSTGSGYFDGTGDYLTGPTGNSTLNNALDILGGDFTIECWLYKTADTSAEIATNFTNLGGNGWELRSRESGAMAITHWVNNSPTTVTSLFSQYSINTWNHIAVVKNSGNYYFYVNGVDAGIFQNGSRAAPANGGAGTGLGIGAYIQNLGYPSYVTGYISDLRIVKGTVVYTGNFTPPTAPLTATQSAGTNIAAITGTSTSLLTLQNRIGYNNSQPIDESGIRNIVTRVGNASAGTFSPHVPTGWSTYFNGSQYIPHSAGTYAKWCGGTNTGFAGKTWTIETWINPEQFGSSQATSIVGRYAGVAANGRWVFYLNVSSTNSSTIGLVWTTSTGTQTQVLSTGTISKFEWSHIAVTIDATTSTVKFYINGILDSTHTGQNFSSQTAFYDEPWIAGGNQYFDYFKGYLHGFRVLQGELLTFGSAPTEPPQPVDKTVYLNFRSNQIVDDSANRCTFTAAGSITPFSPFAPNTVTPDSYSVYFDGSGDYLTSSTSLFNYTTGNAASETFTIEAWVYHTTRTTPTQPYYSQSISGKGDVYLNLGINGSGNLIFYHYDGTARTITGSSVIALNTWTNVAVVVSGGTATIYVDGVSDGNGTWGGIDAGGQDSTSYFGRPATSASAQYFQGYVSNLRVSNNARSISVPVVPYTNDATTDFLTCQSPTVTDNSSNAFAITVNGNTQPTQFNPFGETVTTGVEYAPASHGGSVYFDGTGDTIQMPSNSAFDVGTGKFTMEFWVYPLAYSATYIFRGSSNSSWGGIQWYLSTDAAGSMTMTCSTGGGATNFWAGGVTPLNTWTHVAIVRDTSAPNSWRVFVNGVSIAYAVGAGAANSLETNTTSQPLNIGGFPGWSQTTGYISNFRFIKGTALYTSAFVPPVAPADPIAGTTLLVNGTNAAIQDRTGRTVLETVGNVRVVNGVRKFGSGAIYFDGTGDYLTTKVTPTWANFGTSDFTIECWVYFNSVASTQMFVSSNQNAATGAGGWVFGYRADNTTLFFSCNANQQYGKTWSPSTGTWYHVAVSRSGTDLRLFVDGTQVGSTSTSSDNISNAADVWVGSNVVAPFALNGFIDDLRITKGVARYTENFTAPTATFELK